MLNQTISSALADTEKETVPRTAKETRMREWAGGGGEGGGPRGYERWGGEL